MTRACCNIALYYDAAAARAELPRRTRSRRIDDRLARRHNRQRGVLARLNGAVALMLSS